MRGPKGAISANDHPFPHAVESTLKARAAGFRSQPPRATRDLSLSFTAPQSSRPRSHRIQPVLVEHHVVLASK
eukprot:182967-Pleurochrysis_carterae.AAC.1